MKWLPFATRLTLAVFAALWSVVIAAAELPTADEILKIHTANKEKLSRLHLQVVHRYELTEGYCRAVRKRANEKKKFYDYLTQTKTEDLVLTLGDKKVSGEEAKQYVKLLLASGEFEDIERGRDLKPFQSITPMEFFLNGNEYQFRRPVKDLNTEEELKAWSFPASPVTAETLLTDYRDLSLFSRSATTAYPSRWWQHSADRHAYIMHKHLANVMHISLPPYTDVTHPRWDEWHAFDGFLSQPAEKYRVVRQEEVDGRLLTVLDVTVPMGTGPSSSKLAYRGWLDLKRGAVPIKVFHMQCTDKLDDDHFDRYQPRDITTTQEIRELPNGAFYPSKTTYEAWDQDPDAPTLTAEQWVEVREGKRKLPFVVMRRYSWECTLVEAKTDFDENFFVIPFPEGQKLFDHDAGKMIGALDPKPPVQVGQKAPPLSISHWVDGKQRTLDDFKGHVVVLDFWGLWCSACRNSVPQLKAVQEAFRGKRVVFISIHTAENDPKALATQIAEFKKTNGWQYLGAIDAGKMIEDSVTTNTYGITGFPQRVIIGPDGKVVYSDPQFDGPDCDETNPVLLAEFEKTYNKVMKERFELAGESWPLSEDLDEKIQEEILNRVDHKVMVRHIEAALKNAR